MKDQQLYNLIKKLVWERKHIPHLSETQSFAERYCQNQLKRKINNNQSRQKMGTLLKNFNRLETYYDLPSLIKEIQQTKFKQLQQNRRKSISKVQQNNQQSKAQHKKIQSRSFSTLKNYRSTIQNLYTKDVIEQLQNYGIWKNEVLKNNSCYHMSDVEESIRKCQKDEHQHQNGSVFQNLQRFLKNEKQFILNQKNQKIQKSKVNSEKKKEMKDYLHKISSYLQIILEQQHKSKWKRKRNSSFFKPSNSIIQKQNTPKNVKPQPLNNPFLITPDCSATVCITALKQQTKLLKNESKKSKYLIKKPKSYFFKDQQNGKQNIQGKTSGFKQLNRNLTNEVTNNTTSDTQQFNKKLSSSIKQNFTFRRRSIKQRIIKKIDKFIGDIDDETINNKKQNGYYNYQINKLETNMNKLYGRYRRETIADQKGIQNLIRLAQQFTILNPNRKIPSDESLNNTEKKIEFIES